MLFNTNDNKNEKWYEGAWQLLYLNNYSKVYKIALSIVIDKELAKDVVQEAFVNAFLKIDMLKDKGKFSAWICAISENMAKNMLRQKINRNNRNVPLDNIDFNAYRDISEYNKSNNPELLCETNEKAKEILSYIEELALDEQQILSLKYYNGLSYAEIALQMQLKESAVRMKAFRAKKKLSVKLKKYIEIS